MGLDVASPVPSLSLSSSDAVIRCMVFRGGVVGGVECAALLQQLQH